MEQWTDVRRAVLVEGLSKREVCRRFCLHWETLQRILEHTIPPGYQRIAQVDRPVIGPWLGRIAELLEERTSQPRKQRYTVKRMWELLCKEGFTGGYTTVKDAVRQLRKQAPKEVFMPLTQPPGEAQVDFGYALAAR
jgi:transposase